MYVIIYIYCSICLSTIYIYIYTYVRYMNSTYFLLMMFITARSNPPNLPRRSS